ncbi:hypothetical protein PVAND_010653 [Polypedilum vanderplanki]|uniref:RING-type domain-containing protein n=1 Tax=Polypedilum vanderplanki TaxID=319348 RepID=A0A9J6CGM8_POLVA|nr:hypothetical protein PVAND_010653 [Polypedilum vanderplanki]
MASLNSSGGALQQDFRPFYCHQCAHHWMKSNNSQYECPSCGQGFIEEVTEDFQPNAPELLPLDVERQLPRGPLFNFIFYQNHEDMNQDPETNGRQTRRLPRQTSSDSATRRRNTSQSQRQASRSRSPHVSVLVESNTGNALRIGINTLHSRSAGRFLSVAIDDIMDTFFAPQTRSPAMTDDQMQEIPKVTITAEQVAEELMCSVCFDDFKINENEARKLQCEHIFHEKCIFPWLKTNASCPVCRTKLSNANPQAENNDDEELASLIRVISEYQRRPALVPTSNSGASSNRVRRRERSNAASSSRFRYRSPRQLRQIESSSDEDTNQNNINVPQHSGPEIFFLSKKYFYC